MRATDNIQVLKQAIRAFGIPNIHHSYRGSQYICKDYFVLLKRYNIEVRTGLIA